MGGLSQAAKSSARPLHSGLHPNNRVSGPQDPYSWRCRVGQRSHSVLCNPQSFSRCHQASLPAIPENYTIEYSLLFLGILWLCTGDHPHFLQTQRRLSNLPKMHSGMGESCYHTGTARPYSCLHEQLARTSIQATIEQTAACSGGFTIPGTWARSLP